MKLADRMSRIGTESAFEVLARARALEKQGKSIIHLQIGEPDFHTPANVREAAKRALDEGATHYAPYPGIPALSHVPALEESQPPVLAMHSRKGDTSLRLFTTIATLGTPQDITVQEIRIECFFPADADTSRVLND